jgi:hypothetical protein
MLFKLFNYLKFKYYLWRQERELNKEFSRTVLTDKTNFQLVQDSIKYSYAEGIAQIKKKINNQAQIAGHVKAVENTQDIVSLAEYEDEQRKSVIDTLKKSYVFTREKPQDKMVADRINQYYELQKFNEERELIKAIKKARKEGNEVLANELERDWTTRYKRTTSH